MGKRKLESGKKVNIGKDYDSDQEMYRVKIVAVYKQTIELELPYIEGEIPDIIIEGELLTLSFASKRGLNKLDVKVRKINKKRKKFAVIRQGEIRRIQRRKYVRIPLQKEVKYRRITNLEGNYSTAMMLDMSASGIRMRLDELNGVAMYQVLDFRLDSFSCTIDFIQGRVVRLTEKEDPDTAKPFYDLGVQFIDVSNDKREEMIEWILQKQRELRQKGLI